MFNYTDTKTSVYRLHMELPSLFFINIISVNGGYVVCVTPTHA